MTLDAKYDEPIEIDESLVLDQLGEWSFVKHEIVSKYASAYARIVLLLLKCVRGAAV